MILQMIHRLRYWFLSGIVIISIVMAFVGTTSFEPFGANVHAQTTNLIQGLPCTKQACDNIDPLGRCNQVDPGGGCLMEMYPLEGKYTPTTNSCAGIGERWALLHPNARNIGLAHANITIDGNSKGERIASIDLYYSDNCDTNWISIRPIGICVPQANKPSPCKFSGWIQRSPHDTRDGNGRSVYLLPTSPQGTAYSAMLWAPDVGVQGCASASYPNQGNNFVVSPYACVTQLDF